MYNSPPNIRFVAPTSSAVVGTVTVPVFVPSPGAGFSVRVVGFHMSGIYTIATTVNIVLVDGLGNAYGSVIMTAQTGFCQLLIPEPGLQLPAATAFQGNLQANAASVAIRTFTYYYIDPLT